MKLPGVGIEQWSCPCGLKLEKSNAFPRPFSGPLKIFFFFDIRIQQILRTVTFLCYFLNILLLSMTLRFLQHHLFRLTCKKVKQKQKNYLPRLLSNASTGKSLPRHFFFIIKPDGTSLVPLYCYDFIFLCVHSAAIGQHTYQNGKLWTGWQPSNSLFYCPTICPFFVSN